MLEVRGLSTSYGNIKALKGIDLDVAAGSVVCILGANGAGKSTFMKTVTGLLAPAEGGIRFEGEEIAGLAPEAIVRKGISLVPEGRAILTRMTVLENIEMGAYHRKGDAVGKDLDRIQERFPVLKIRKGQRAGSLSGGEQQMLAITRALMARPKLLLLDEPSLGLAPLIVSDIFRIVREVNAEGTTVLLVEQNARQALKASSYAYVLETGKIAHHGTSADLRNDPKIKESYLGGRQW